MLRNAVDKFYGENILHNPQKPSSLHRVDLLEKVIRESDEPPVILALGPLTNIAKVLDKNPMLESKIEKIIIMGGAIKSPGNIIVENWSDYLKNEVAEWSIYIDSLAAQKTFRSKI